ncbi:MAG: DUF1302 family protein [Chitinivibrionales bacterium]
MKNLIFKLLWALCAVQTAAPAQQEFEMDESALFGDTAMIVDSEQFTDSASIIDEKKQKTVSFSGDIAGSVTGTMNRSYFDDATISNTGYQSTAFSNFNLDVRLPGAVKSFIDAEAIYYASNESLDVDLNEMFLDWNIGYNVFFRAGKQVLQWGRGYFFNPVDLVNVEKTRFLNELGSREGAFGLKVHVPIQTRANLYAFVDMGKVPRADSLAMAAKAEFLVKSVEFAFSAWGKNKTDPVFGFDFSTGLFDFMISGEAALHRSITIYTLGDVAIDTTDEQIALDSKSYDWVPRLSLGIGRYFDIGDINDRLMINFEGYFNQAGTDRKDLLPGGLDMRGLTTENLLEQLPPDILPLIFRQNNLSKWYVAAFATFNRFIISDMTLTANALVNLNQKSAMVQAGVNYTTLHNLSFDLIVTGFPGPDYTEYTIAGQGMAVELRTGIRF